jgi:predicted site-specific integrase-resolvase
VDFISFTAAAEEKSCGRATLYRAARDGRIDAQEVAGRRVIVANEKYEAFEPQHTGARAARQKNSGGGSDEQ